MGLGAQLVGAEGTAPRAKAAEYRTHGELTKVSIGAEYLVHSFSGRNHTFVARDYLVVEVAVYPGPEMVSVRNGHFTLRVNGKKQTLFPQPPGFVAASLKYPDWERRPSLEASAGPVVMGRQERVERFPGDPRAEQTRLPRPPRAPEEESRSGLDSAPQARADEVVVEAALPEVETKLPVSGYLYFAFRGKTKSIRLLELIYDGPAGRAILRLQ